MARGGGVKIPRDAVSPAERQALAHGTVVHLRTGEARFAVTGKGALLCLQGLVTCDLAKAPDRSRLYGALLTNKGMIVTPLWIERQAADRFTVEAPAAGGAAARDIFAKSLPPRLCTWQEISSLTTGVDCTARTSATTRSAFRARSVRWRAVCMGSRARSPATRPMRWSGTCCVAARCAPPMR